MITARMEEKYNELLNERNELRGQVKSLQSEIATLVEDLNYQQMISNTAQKELAALKPQWISVDGVDSDLTERGYYWWNPRYAVNEGKKHWTVISFHPEEPQGFDGIFVGPLPPPPETE